MTDRFQPDLMCGTDGCRQEFCYVQADPPEKSLLKTFDHWRDKHPGVGYRELHDNLRFLCAGCRTPLNEARGTVFTGPDLSRACAAGGTHTPYPKERT